AVVGLGIPVIRSEDVRDSALWLTLLGRRRAGVRPLRDRPVYAQRRKAAPDHVPEAMLAAVPGISAMRARALLREFGSGAAVVRAGPEAWTEVRGVGPTVARALARAVS